VARVPEDHELVVGDPFRKRSVRVQADLVVEAAQDERRGGDLAEPRADVPVEQVASAYELGGEPRRRPERVVVGPVGAPAPELVVEDDREIVAGELGQREQEADPLTVGRGQGRSRRAAPEESPPSPRPTTGGDR
jgi:hypothetical protein